jgi:Flp pilus assembly protein TadD
VLAVFHQAEQAPTAENDRHNPMVWHLAAVAALRLGREPEAKGYWQQALKLRPGFDLAQENLADLRQPKEKRNAPWAFPLNNWLNVSTVKELSRLIANLKGRSEEALKGVVQRFLPQVERWLYDALQATHDGDDEEAEQLLKQALAMEPDKPDLLNNLAAVYAATGREPAALELWQQIFDRSPDYLFARASLARAAALRGEADKARELLAPLFSRRRLHFSEFAAFSGAQIDLLLAEGHKDGARSWFEMWAEATPDDPRLDHYRRLVGKPARKMDWRDRFRGQRT